MRKVLCVCPCCGAIIRVSDLKIYLKEPIARTWLDEYEKQSQRLTKKEEKFDETEEEIREKSVELGRKEAAKVFNKAIAPSFRALRYDPFDVKPILNPVDFAIFHGLNKNSIAQEIVLLSRACGNSQLNAIRKQVKKAVENNYYNWQVARINETGSIVFE